MRVDGEDEEITRTVWNIEVIIGGSAEMHKFRSGSLNSTFFGPNNYIHQREWNLSRDKFHQT